MNIDVHSKVDEEDEPLTRADVENFLHEAGSTDKLKLIGLNLRGINLTNFNLERADLTGANLSGADLTGASLWRANLWGASLSGANLSGVDFSGANLSGVDFSGANLRRAILGEANLSIADLRGADLSYADLSRANLSRADLRRANLRRANLEGANLKEAVGLNDSDKLHISAEEDISIFRICIVEEPLTPHNLTLVISAITDLATKCWLIAKGRLSDLIEYMQTHDVRFIEESKLIITNITYNSPFEANFKIDLTASNVAEAIKTTIDGVIQAKQRLEKAELKNKEKAQKIEQSKQKADHEKEIALLELERQKLAVEKERLEILEKRLEVQKKGIEYAFEIAVKTVTVLHPNADEQTKALLIQTLLPTILQLQNGKGLELALPVSQSEEKTVEPENG